MTAPEPLADAALVSAIRAGSAGARAAEEALCRRYASRIRTYGMRHLGAPDRAADLVQEVLLVVLDAARAGRIEEPERLGGFVLGTCRFVVWEGRRGERRLREVATEAAALLPEAIPAPETVDARALERCLRGLPPREATVIRMSFHEESSAEEIGAALALTAVNVRVIRHRALGRLAACLEAPATKENG